MPNDFILNGAASGDVAQVLLRNNFDVGALRPFVETDGDGQVTGEYITRNGVAQPVRNANATLRKDDWKILDTAILKVAKPRLRAVADLRSNGLTFNVPDGMGKTVLEYEDQSDITAATVSMDGIRESDADRPEFSLKYLPLPIIHKDFRFSARQVMTSRSSPGRSPIDTTSAELAGRRVAEEAEKLLIGTSSSGYQYGGGNVYGYTTFPQRLTQVLTAPTNSPKNYDVILGEVLAMKTLSQDNYHYGPWFCYCSTDWDKFMDDDYVTGQGGDKTLRDRIGAIEGVDRPMTLDYLPAKTLLLVEKSTDVAREVIGMDITTVQWESHGGMMLNFKVMAILVPQLRTDQNGNTGIVEGTYP